MKYSVCLILLLSGLTHAQPKYSTDIGVKAGVSLSSFQIQPANYGINPNIGIYATNNYSKFFSLELGVAYLPVHLKLSDILVSDYQSQSTYNSDYNYRYKSIALDLHPIVNITNHISFFFGASGLFILDRTVDLNKKKFVQTKEDSDIRFSYGEDNTKPNFQLTGDFGIYYRFKNYFISIGYSQKVFKVDGIGNLYGIDSYIYIINFKIGYLIRRINK